MAAPTDPLDQKKLSCSVCQDLLKHPVTIPCGHSYCKNCIKSHWDEEDQKEMHSCPQCRQTFWPRPGLVKNTILADLVEDLRKTQLQAASTDHFYAGPEDMACDVCKGRKRKATKSCLQCQVSYCDQHLQPHYEVLQFKKHKLMEASSKFKENICAQHEEVMNIFCRTDQQCICYLCSMDEHKGHDTVSATAEMKKKQKELDVSRQRVQQRIQDREKDVKLLQQEVEAINRAADKAVADSEKILTELIHHIEKKISDVKEQVKSQQKTEVSRVKELQKKVQQEITELKTKDTKLEQLSQTSDHIQFLHNYSSLSHLSEYTYSPCINMGPLQYFKGITTAVSKVRDKLQKTCDMEWQNNVMTVTAVNLLLLQEPKIRAGVSQYAVQWNMLKLDRNTANKQLMLSGHQRKATSVKEQHMYQSHPDRFMDKPQVLSTKGLTGRCYWKARWKGYGVSVAVAYKDVARAGEDSEFGNNDKSWALERTDKNKYTFKHDSNKIPIPGPWCSTVGVYLDHSAGILSFYSVSDTVTPLLSVRTTFTQPVHAGLGVHTFESSARFCDIN